MLQSQIHLSTVTDVCLGTSLTVNAQTNDTYFTVNATIKDRDAMVQFGLVQAIL